MINDFFVSFSYTVLVTDSTPCPEKNGPPKQNAVTCTIYNTIQ